MIVSVFLIISDKRLVWEELAKEKYRIDREWWVPLVFLFIALFLGAVKLEHVINSVYEDLEIIVLILSLAFVGRGLSRSGLFRYLAYKIVERAEG